MERFLHDKLDSFSGECLERIVEADLSGVLALLDENGGCQHPKAHPRKKGDVGLLSGDAKRVLRSNLQQSSSCGSKGPVSSDFDVDWLGGPP